ncbi:GMC family oxidoreductase N-terminal domain-containing protein [Phyllobacterium sp. 0TCS1.6C]|uniref:GMC family oxidoreductase n=1 Tax=unclassified Phyllobacterium TaxID=2638441 RepID=UPI0022645BF7|nr:MULTISPECIES: GMC family oxidoreductase N-terminal domain-containing protein [unclassified Phyllobacterium]MCX8278834.1 GMC family oxidoreductase N-terminal domain-containing protein [Phyllobacterium sp. 0TCS1.6C]MCX8293618.1 GMC family oxidoreductase N-terminal domain-containing protein [Phyllobacterium sp. 0TCS1.6A]
MIVDHLILGGGSAGCVLAARLSADPRRRVALIEAGRNISADDIPEDIRSRYPGRAYLDTRNIWSELTAMMGYARSNAAPRSSRRYEQARLLGGGSAINALMANRGAPADYADWQGLGAEGWDWDDCLPYFLKIEADRDFRGPLHGQDGPLTIRRVSDDKISPFVDRVMKTLDRRGHPIKPDQNGPWEDGVFRGALAVSDRGERMPTSLAYLTPDVRKRTNLRIITESVATRILFDGRRATGAQLSGATMETIHAAEVIVSAGAIHSPALLLRSGVGSVRDLASKGVDVVASREGVGRNLMEHPSIAVAAYLPPHMRVRDESEHHEQAVWRFSSGLDGTPSGDMHAAILSRSGWHSVGQRLGSLFFWVNKSYSRGVVKLASADPTCEPDVDFRMLSDERDLIRLKLAVRMGAEVLSDPFMNGHRGTAFPSSYSPRVAKVAVPGAWNALQRGILSGLLDVAGPFRPALVHSAITLGTTMKGLLTDDDALTEFVRRHVGGTWHPSGTCRMGSADDPMAVTSPTGRVYGIEGLRVCDASLMPSIPCANTNMPTIMIAERVADFILAGR